MENICQICKLNTPQLLCKCSNVLLCEQCLGTHIMHIVPAKHKPVLLSQTEYSSNSLPRNLEHVLQSKLNNEILELEEFRKLALQKVSELLQNAEQELLETAERVMISLNNQCEVASKDLNSAISLINFRETSDNYILNLFKSCKTAENVRELKIVHKSLEYSSFNVAQIINSSIHFNLQITDKPTEQEIKEKDLTKLTFNFDNYTPVVLTKDSLSEARKTIKNLEIELVRNELSGRPVSRGFKKSCLPAMTSDFTSGLFYFLPYTNKIFWFSPEENCFQDFYVPGRRFLKDSAWSLCEGGKIMNTGGFGLKAEDLAFFFDLNTRTEIKVPRLPSKRCRHGQVSLGKYIYVIGGVSKKGSLKTVDIFSLKTQKWRNSRKMNYSREYPGVCTHDGKVFIAGGVGHNSIELYNPITKKFTLLGLKIPVSGRCCLFSYDDLIIVLKGEYVYQFATGSANIIEKGKVLSSDWVMSGDPFVTSNFCFFFYFTEVFKMNISECCISYVDCIPE